MKREPPTMIMTMNRAVADAEHFYARERERVMRELDERLHPRVKLGRRERRQRGAQTSSYELRLQKRLKT